MAMTTAQQTDAYRFFIIAFGAAPGVEYMSQIADAYNAGMTTKQIVNIYTTKPQFKEIYPSFFTNAQFADKLIESVVGSSATDAAKTEAKADVAAALAAGWSQGDVVYQIFTNLANKSLSDPQWGNTAKLLANEVAVAKYYTEVMLGNTTDLSQLREIVDGVTHTTDVSTPAAIAQFIEDATSEPAPIYALTANHASVNEGATVLFTLDTTHVAAGTTFAYTITGVDAADVVGGSLTGVATVDSQGKAVIAVSLTEDATTEGSETISLSVAGQTTTSAVNDTSLTPDAVLTTGNDLVSTGLGDDTIIGNSSTYNSGDEINGGEGTDTLKLDLLSSNTPYDVGNVNNVEQLFVRTLEVVDADENTNPEVTLLLTNYEGLETLNIDRSRADITVEDLQGGVDVVINDMRGDVTIGFDQQNVPDEVNVSIREFGQSATGASDNSDFQDEADIDGAEQDDEASGNKDHDFGGHDADLTIDEGVATVNLTDAGTTGFESDLSIAGGFSTLNVDGGVEGLSLTIHDVNSSAFNGYGEDGVTVDATEFAGDLTIDADAVNVLNTGVGDDVITTDMAYGGDINAGNGDNTVTIGSTNGDDSEQDDLQDGGSITTGSGVDLVRIDDDAAGAISTGASDDTVEIGADVGEDSGLDAYQGGWGSGDLESTGSIDTGAGSDTVLVRDDVKGSIDTGLTTDVAADGDTVTIGDDVYITGSVTTGAGADTVVVGDDSEASHYMAGDITTGTENDTVTVHGNVAGDWWNNGTAATITTEDGDDVVTVDGTVEDDSEISTGNGNDDVTIGAGIDAAAGWWAVDALVDLGAGNDELMVTGNVNGDIDAGAGNDDIEINDGSIGSTSNIAGGAGESDTLSLVDIGEDSTDLSIAVGAITSIETLNLVDYVASGEDDFNVDLNAFDGDLGTVNIVKFNSGNSEANLFNVADEQISISAQDNVPETDVTLNVTSAASSLAVSLESDIGGNHFVEGEDGMIEPSVVTGNTDFDVVINDDSETPIADLNLANNGEAVSDDVFWDGYEKGRTVTLDGEDFDGTLTITGDMANNREGYAESDSLRQLNQQDGNLLLVSGIAAATIEAGSYAGDLNLVLADDESHTITLGSGDDVVNLLGDTLDVNDDIDFGDGIDRLIVNDDTQTTGDDSDEVFGDLISLEELEVRGDGGTSGDNDGLLEVSLDDDALDSDIQRVIVDADGLTDANVLLDIGADWENRDLRVDVFNGQVEINNDSNNDLTIFTDASEGGRDITIDNNDGGTSTVYIGIDSGEDATIASGNAYDYAQYDENTENPEFGYGNDGEVELDAQSGSIDSITLLDNAKDTESENGDIEVTVADAWAKGGSLTIDASDISNEDGNDNTGGLTLRGGLEDDATLTVIGTDNDDAILGGQLGDNLSGGLGDDVIIGDPTGPVLPGVQQESTVVFTDEVLDAGDVYTVTLNGEDYTYTVVGEDGIDDVGAALADAINLDGDLDASYDADTDTLTVTGNDTYTDELTGDELPLGESFIISAGAVNFPVTAEVEAVTLADETYDAGDQIVIDIGGVAPVPFTVTVTSAGGTQAEVLAEVIAAFNADLTAIAEGYTASASDVDGQLLISAPADGSTEFSLSASVTDVAPTAEEEQFTLAGMTAGFVSITVNGVSYGVAFDTDVTTTATALAAAIDAAAAPIDATSALGVITVSSSDGSAITIGGYSVSTGTLTYDGEMVTGVSAAELTDNTDPTDNGELVNAAPAGVVANTAPVVDTTIDAVAAQEPDSELGGADTIDGGEGNNSLYGVVGDDIITAGSGNNYVEGGDGNDTITLGNGTNEVYGDDGDDIINIAVANAGTNLVDGHSYVEGGAGDDSITLGDGGSEVYGDDGVDTITTGAGADVIYGGAGGDLIQANGGSDTFGYLAASDSTGAAQGFDIITGVTAGAAGDVFDFTALDLDGVVFLGNFENENVANTAISASVTNKLEVVFVEYTAGDHEGWIYADTNYNGTIDTADLAIKVVGLSGDLTAANFATGV